MIIYPLQIVIFQCATLIYQRVHVCQAAKSKAAPAHGAATAHRAISRTCESSKTWERQCHGQLKLWRVPKSWGYPWMVYIMGNPKKNTPARARDSGGRMSMYQIHPDTSNRSYGAVTDQVRHYRNCSSRNLLWHKKQHFV